MTEVGITVSTEECIEWDGRLQSQGYGMSGEKLVHRLVWEENCGPILDGAHVLHRCDNPPCINIDHLFLGTAKDNARDMAAKKRQWQQKKQYCKRGHLLAGDNLVNSIVRKRGHRICKTCVEASKNTPDMLKKKRAYDARYRSEHREELVLKERERQRRKRAERKRA